LPTEVSIQPGGFACVLYDWKFSLYETSVGGVWAKAAAAMSSNAAPVIRSTLVMS
jgi:hypothetical protein